MCMLQYLLCGWRWIEFRSQAYEEYFRYLDQTGGFFYERWGDAPVHSLGAVMLLNSSQVRLVSWQVYIVTLEWRRPARPRSCQSIQSVDLLADLVAV